MNAVVVDDNLVINPQTRAVVRPQGKGVLALGGSDDPAADKTAGEKSGTTTTSAAAPATGTPRTITVAQSAAKLPAAHYATMAASVGNIIVMPGGLDAKKTSTPVVWQFDPATGETKNIARLPVGTRDPAVGVIGDQVLVAGGAKGETNYDAVATIGLDGTLATVGRLPGRRSDGAAVTSEDGATMYVVGGYDGTNPTNDVLSTTDGITFTIVATLPQPMRNTTAVLLGRSIWVIGGDWADQELTTVFRVDLVPVAGATTGAVTQIATLPNGLTRSAAFTLGGGLFVAGGRSSGKPTAQILSIDPVSGVVSEAGALPVAVSDAMVGVVGTTAYLLGGQTTEATDAIYTLTTG